MGEPGAVRVIGEDGWRGTLATALLLESGEPHVLIELDDGHEVLVPTKALAKLPDGTLYAPLTYAELSEQDQSLNPIDGEAGRVLLYEVNANGRVEMTSRRHNVSKAVVALYDDIDAAQEAVRDLVHSGVRRDTISLVSGPAEGSEQAQSDASSGVTQGAGAGAALGGLAGLLAGLGVLAIPGVGPLIAAGPLATALAGAGVGAISGSLVGALHDAGIPEREAQAYADAIRRGGTLVTVRPGDDQAAAVGDILARHGAVDVNSRAAGRRDSDRSEYGQSGAAAPSARTQQDEAVAPASDAPYATSPVDMGERIGPQRIDSTYGGAEAKNVQRVGTDFAQEQSLDVRNNAPEHVQPAEEPTQRGGFSSGAGQTGAGYQGGPGGESTPGANADRVSAMEPDVFRRHYDAVYGSSGRDYEMFRPAYTFGSWLSANDPNSNHRWSDVEADARTQWLRQHPETAWDDYREAVRYGWERGAGENQDPASGWPKPVDRQDRPAYQGPEEGRI
jgi:hypothetical protein